MKEIKSKASTQNTTIVPNDWADFAPLLDIKSGSNLIKFQPYPYQIALHRLIKRYPNIVILKTRQLGVTEFVLSVLLHKAILNPAFSAATFSLQEEDAKDCSQRSRTMLKSLGLPTTNDNVSELTLRNGGSIFYKNSSPNGSRSRSLSFLFYDESGHSRNIAEIVASSAPSLTLTDAATQLFASTPSSTASYFFTDILSADNGDVDILEICKRVASGKLYSEGIPGFYYFTPNEEICKVIVHWLSIPKFAALNEKLKDQGGYLAWRKKKNSLSEIILQRDHNLQFLSGESAVFSTDLVENALRGDWEPSREKGKEYRYIAGLDTNVTGNNWLVLTIIKENLVTKLLSLVAMYRGRKKSQEFHIYEISSLIKKFKIDRIVIEQNQGGAFYLERVVQLFPEVDIKGYDTTGQSKPIMIGRLLSALERSLLEMPNDNIIRKEFLNFSQIGNQYEAIAGNDDIVMSLAVALQRSELATIPDKEEGFDFDEELLEGLSNGRGRRS